MVESEAKTHPAALTLARGSAGYLHSHVTPASCWEGDLNCSERRQSPLERAGLHRSPGGCCLPPRSGSIPGTAAASRCPCNTPTPTTDPPAVPTADRTHIHRGYAQRKVENKIETIMGALSCVIINMQILAFWSRGIEAG